MVDKEREQGGKMGTLNVGTLTRKPRGLTDVMERGEIQEGDGSGDFESLEGRF